MSFAPSPLNAEMRRSVAREDRPQRVTRSISGRGVVGYDRGCRVASARDGRAGEQRRLGDGDETSETATELGS